MRHAPSVLESIRDLSKDQILALLSLAKEFKLGRGPSLAKPAVVTTLFLSPSTRTKLSFALAAKRLRACYLDFPGGASALEKGESLKETFLTLKALGVDLVIFRTPIANAMAAWKATPPLKIINAGDGHHQHPTQALGDLFTMFEMGFSLEGATVAVVGDHRHSRVSRSLVDLLPLFQATVLLCGPPELWPEGPLPARVSTTSSLEEAIARADLLYLLRLQKERHQTVPPSVLEEYPERYGLSLSRLKKRVPVFHPGPANIGVEISRDLIEDNIYTGHLQVQHAVPMRMAVITSLLQNHG